MTKKRKKKSNKRVEKPFKQWLCNRFGCVSCEEFDAFTDDLCFIMEKLDNFIGEQDSFNRLVGERLHLKGKDEDCGDMYG